MVRNDHDHSLGWRWGARWRRAQWGLQVWCHRSTTCSDRWVFQPKFIWDRKATAFGRSSDG